MTGRIIYYVTLSPNLNGLLYPVYTKPPNNIPLIHQVDEEYRISSFVEAYDLEGFHTVSSIKRNEHDIGDYCPFAYFDHNRNLEETDLNEMRFGFSGLKEGVLAEIGALPTLTRLHIARALQRPVGEQTVIWREFANSFLRSDEARRIYLSSQISTTQSEKKIWQSIRETAPKITSIFDQDAFFGDMDETQLRLWLTRNREDFRFPYGWLRLDRNGKPDEQLYALGVDWFLSRYSELRGLSSPAFAIFARLISMFKDFELHRDFAEFAIDSFAQGEIFNCVPPLDETAVRDFFSDIRGCGIEFDQTQIAISILELNKPSSSIVSYFLHIIVTDAGISELDIQRLRAILTNSTHIRNLMQEEGFKHVVDLILRDYLSVED